MLIAPAPEPALQEPDPLLEAECNAHFLYPQLAETFAAALGELAYRAERGADTFLAAL